MIVYCVGKENKEVKVIIITTIENGVRHVMSEWAQGKARLSPPLDGNVPVIPRPRILLELEEEGKTDEIEEG